ncbi:GNAT family N-acetyltransferase [Arcobacter sp.]|uniref:GNAT family N-acetyltransferase n=1 Tax=Arcobacter sp. TaxID=1872629 RepID=UPI003D0FA7D1
MKIEKANLDDIKELLFIEEKLFLNDSSALSKASFSYHLKRNIIYKIKIDKKTVAYILWLKRKNYYRLYSLAILKEFQGKGLGKSLLEFSLNTLDKDCFELEVRVSNQTAINLYEKFGFKKVKVLEEFYDDEDGIKMRLKR